MTNRLIASVLAVSVALTTAFTAPARADNSGEIGGLLLGAGALFIIGSTLSHNNNRYATRRYVEPRHGYAYPSYRYGNRDYGYSRRHNNRHATRRYGGPRHGYVYPTYRYGNRAYGNSRRHNNYNRRVWSR